MERNTLIFIYGYSAHTFTRTLLEKKFLHPELLRWKPASSTMLGQSRCPITHCWVNEQARIYTWSRTHAPAFTGPWSNGRQRLVRSSWIVSVYWEQGGRRRLCLGGSVACCIRVLKMVKGLPWRLRNDLQLGKREDVTQYKTKWTAKSWESTKWNAFNDTTLIWKGFCWILNKRSWGRWWPWMFRMQYDIQYFA